MNLTEVLQTLRKDPQDRNALELERIQQSTKEIPFFKKYINDGDKDVHQKCCKFMRTEIFHKDETIFNIDSIGSKFYLILQGKVGVYIRLPKKAEEQQDEDAVSLTCVKELFAGEAFGELALLNNKPRLASIVSHDANTILAVLNKKDFTEILKEKEEAKLLLEMGFFAKMPFFTGWNFNLVKLLYLNVFRVKYSKGDYVFQEAAEPNAVFIITSGTFDIEKTFKKELTEDEEDREVWNKAKNLHHIGANKKAKTVIRMMSYQPHELFGEEDILNNQEKRTFGAVCTSASGECIMIKRRDFFLRILKDETARNYLQKRVQTKNTRMNEKINTVKSSLLSYSNYLYNDSSALKQQKDSIQDLLPNQRWNQSVIKNYVHPAHKHSSSNAVVSVNNNNNNSQSNINNNMIQASPEQLSQQFQTSYQQSLSSFSELTPSPLKPKQQSMLLSSQKSMSPLKRPAPQFLQGFFPSETSLRSKSPSRTRRQFTVTKQNSFIEIQSPGMLEQQQSQQFQQETSPQPQSQMTQSQPMHQSPESKRSPSEQNRKLPLTVIIPPRQFRNFSLTLIPQQVSKKNLESISQEQTLPSSEYLLKPSISTLYNNQDSNNTSSKLISPIDEELPNYKSALNSQQPSQVESMNQLLQTLGQPNDSMSNLESPLPLPPSLYSQMSESNQEHAQSLNTDQSRSNQMSMHRKANASVSLPPLKEFLSRKNSMKKTFLQDQQVQEELNEDTTDRKQLLKTNSFKLSPVKLKLNRLNPSDSSVMLSSHSMQAAKPIVFSNARLSTNQNTSLASNEYDLKIGGSNTSMNSKHDLIGTTRQRKDSQEDTIDTSNNTSVLSRKLSSVYFNSTLFLDRVIHKQSAIKTEKSIEKHEQNSNSLLHIEVVSTPFNQASENRKKQQQQNLTPIQQWQKSLLQKQTQSSWTKFNTILEKNQQLQSQLRSLPYKDMQNQNQLVSRVGTEFSSILKQIVQSKTNNHLKHKSLLS